MFLLIMLQWKVEVYGPGGMDDDRGISDKALLGSLVQTQVRLAQIHMKKFCS